MTAGNRHGSRRVASRTTRSYALCVVAAVFAATVTLIPAAPASAAAPTVAKESPTLPSAPLVKVAPELGKGDFNDPPPHPADMDKVRPVPKESYDPARSTVVDSETTPTRKTVLNPDGTRTVLLSTEPTRYLQNGVWKDIDRSLTAAADGSLSAKSAPGSTRLAARADGVTTLDTPAGQIAIRHPGASATAAAVAKDSASYPGALGRRDLRALLTAEGVEEFVSVPDAAAGASYQLEVTLPPGLVARDGDGGVEFVDASGRIVAAANNGWAADAHVPMPSLSPVRVRIAVAKGPTVTLDVALRSPEWLSDDPSRRFPVVIDPSITIPGNPSLAQDAMVINGSYVNTNFGTYPEIWEAVDGVGLARSFVRFDGLPTPSTSYWVSSATLTLTQSAVNCPATPTALAVQGPATTWSESTLTWANQPAMTPNAGATTPAPACVVGSPAALDLTWLAWMWLQGSMPNNGVMVAEAAESDPTARGHQFHSTEATTGAIPTLSITYGTGTPPPVARPRPTPPPTAPSSPPRRPPCR